MLVLIILALLLWSLFGVHNFVSVVATIKNSELADAEAFKRVYKINRSLFFVLSGPLVWIVTAVFYLYDISHKS